MPHKTHTRARSLSISPSGFLYPPNDPMNRERLYICFESLLYIQVCLHLCVRHGNDCDVSTARPHQAAINHAPTHSSTHAHMHHMRPKQPFMSPCAFNIPTGGIPGYSFSDGGTLERPQRRGRTRAATDCHEGAATGRLPFICCIQSSYGEPDYADSDFGVI